MMWLGISVILVLVLVPLAYTDATCPCVEGGLWEYKGQSLYYCQNPNSVKTSWCPTMTHPNGSYTSELPFAYCEGDILTACEQAQVSSLPECPCVEGGVWKYKGQSQSYCSDPTNAGYRWCATEVDLSSKEFTGSGVRCSADILAACQVAAETLPPVTCPCLSGGQWTFDGEPQSYCKQPKGIGKSPWCPTSRSTVSTGILGSFSKEYCTGRELEACQLLEGTKQESECPCVDGGQFTYQGNQYSYCETTKWCATEVDSDGGYVGKFAMCEGEEKAACHELHQLQTTEGKTEMFGEYTVTNTGCPCWFDLTRSDCACCTSNGMQCGAPMQEYCTSKKEGRQAGCLGVPANHWTLSSTGYPCYWDTSRTDCAWCAAGGGQCGSDKGPDSTGGSRCWDLEDLSYCDSVPGDCKHIPTCDSQATCDFSTKFGEHREVHTCSCKPGWTGNGIQCFDDSTGAASEGPSDLVDITLAVSTQYYVYPHDSSQFPLDQVDLVSNITALFEAGASCQTTSGCNGTFVNFDQSGQDSDN